MDPELDARSKQVLKTLVRLYIDSGTPVGSRMLARASGLDVSPATVRNLVSDLEEQGLVHSPHTSAGRVPTSRGYRLFVGIMREMRAPDEAERARIRESLDHQSADAYQLYHAVSRLISGRTHYVGVVLVPRLGQGRFRQIDFLALAQQRILAILVTTAGIVQNRIVELDLPVSESELEQAANYLNEHYTGWSLHSVRDALAARTGEGRPVAGLAARLGWTALDIEEDKELFIEGQGNLLDYPELAKRDRLRELFEILEEPEEMARVLGLHGGEGESEDGVSLMIGEEAGHEALAACSVVTADYATAGEGYGRVAVIGPARMNYADTIPFVGCTARELASVLDRNRPPGEARPA